SYEKKLRLEYFPSAPHSTTIHRLSGWKAECMSEHMPAMPSSDFPSKSRAEEVMLRTRSEQRSSTRASVCLSATAILSGAIPTELVALLREVSNSGAMFYTNLTESAMFPEVGTDVAVRFQLPISDRTVRVLWTGTIVRLIRYSAGAATGIAMKLNSQ